MNPEQEQFDGIRRILVIKRYEQPPPGYFSRFSAQVIARIEAGDHRRFEQAELGAFARFSRFWTALETRPAFASGFGIALCGVLLAGVVYSNRMETLPPDLAVFGQSQVFSIEPPVTTDTFLAPPVVTPVVNNRLLSAEPEQASPVLQSLFGSQPEGFSQPAAAPGGLIYRPLVSDPAFGR